MPLVRIDLRKGKQAAYREAISGQGVDLLEKRGWDDRAGDMIEA